MRFSIDNLNEVQKEAVLVTEGPVMILAGAGSGKTRTLVTRISYLLNEKNISPHQLLALTFSNKAAKEMRERISHDVEFDIGALQITTFHAFCAKLLRSEATHLGLSRNFTIYDDSESKAIVKTLLDRRGISTKEVSPYDILNYIDGLKNFAYYPGREELNIKDITVPQEEDEYYDYLAEYESELNRANAIDFGGLITSVIQLFEKYPDVLERYQKRFKYVLVDEYQDTNRAQFELIKYLCGKHRNICVVGDEDQSIYSWRGADIRNILDFEKVFEDVVVLKLEQNYRSSKNIIEAASAVIEKNVMRKGKQMWTENPDGDSVNIIETFNDKDEAEFVAREIMHLKKGQVRHDDFAVFYRTNAQARLIEDALRKYKIPYKVIGGVRFYERKEIKDILAYLRIIINPKDNLAISRIINVPARGIGATSLRKFEVEAINTNLSLFEVLEKIISTEEFSHLKLSAKVRSSISEFVTLIHECKILDDNKIKPSKIYEKVLHESGYFAFLKANKDFETLARLENLDELLNAIVQFEEGQTGANLQAFLESVTLDTTMEDNALEAENTESEKSGEVSLMTVHGAKGLEFLYAFLVGAEENMFPSFRSVESGDMAMEEERRLFYVAMTRAMKKLYITFALGRMLFGQIKFNGPSRFLDEIPEHLFNWKKLDSMTSDFESATYRSKNMAPKKNWAPLPSYEDNDDEHFADISYDDHEEVIYQTKASKENIVRPAHFHQATFPVGSLVQHNLYGKGVVQETEGNGQEEKVVIKFNDGHRKKFMVKFAPITLC